MEFQLKEANKSLHLRIIELEGLIAQQNKKIDLLFSTINGLGHMLPTLYKKFQDQWEVLCQED